MRTDETLFKADQKLDQMQAKIYELDRRLCSLENHVNAIHQKVPVWWNKEMD